MKDAHSLNDLTRLQTVLNSVCSPICYLDSSLCYVYFNSAYEECIGQSLEDVRGQHLQAVVGETIFELIQPEIELAMRGETVLFEGHLPSLSGNVRFTRIQFTPDCDDKNQVRGMTSVITDLHEHKEQENTLRNAFERMERRAMQDSLTGLGNHRAFLDQLAEAERAFELDGAPCALLFFDVDSFKSFNDSFGHPAGDLVLKQVASLFQKELRPKDLAVRYGGEEFAVLMNNTNEMEAMRYAERLRCVVQNAPWPLRCVTVSGGVACFSKAIPLGTSVLQLADSGLYLAKRSGRNRVCLVHQEPKRFTMQNVGYSEMESQRKPAFA